MRNLAPGALLVLTMAQPNIATGMMPFYRASWDLKPVVIALVFGAYLFALVPVLATVGRPSTRRGWWWRIEGGAACSVVADVVMICADSPVTACLARIAAGGSVGLLTGSIAGLILERRGERGRTAMATGTVLGSAVGTVAAALFAQYLPEPHAAVYFTHAVLIAVVAGAVCAERSERAATPGPDSAVSHSVEGSPAFGPRRAVGFLCGVSAWVSAGLVVALVPSYGAELLATRNLALLAAPVAVYLVSAWVAQRVTDLPASAAGWRRRITRAVSDPVVAQCITISGVTLFATLPLVSSLSVLIVGAVLAGVGQGLTYRAGLQIVSVSTPPGAHARVASRYAAVAYLSAAVTTVACGVLATVSSISFGVLATAALLTAVAGLSAAIRNRPERRAGAPSLADAVT